MAKINVTSGTASAYGQGELQLQNKAPMDGTLRFVTDSSNTASPLLLSTSLVQTQSTLKITTSDNPYIDAEDNSGNNRFTVGRDPASQQVNVDFASNPTGSTTIVGAIRTYVDGVNLSEVMAFREDGNIGINTLTPGSKLDVHSGANVIAQFNRTGTGKSWIQYLQAGSAKWNTGYDNTNGNFTIYDAIGAADRMVVTSAGNVGIGTTTPSAKLNVLGDIHLGDYINAVDRVIDFRTNNSLFTITTYGASGGLGTNLTYSWANGGQGPLTFNNAIGEVMRLSATGNVGIGTTAPESKLHVADGVSGGTVSVFVDNNINALNSTAQIKFTVDAGGSLTGGGAAIQAVNVDPNFASTDLVFRNSGNSIGSLSEAMRITAIGTSYLRLSNTIGGIQFNGDTAAANALNDYEEGTFTPTVGGTWITNPINISGRYTKIGRMVYISIEFTGGVKATSTSGYLDGLPFAGAVGGGGTVTNVNVDNKGIMLLDNSTIIWFTEVNFAGLATKAMGSYML